MCNRKSLWLQAFIAGIATGTSLFWSLGMGWIPCDMCWYERIAMYPIFLIATIALIRKDDDTFRYVFPLSVIGGLLSLWHFLEQIFPNTFSASSICASPRSCTIPAFQWFGWIVPPLFSWVAFVMIGICAWLFHKQQRKGKQ